jgi:hypothetical protein
MNNCHECGSDIIYPNDAFDVISKCSNNDCETNQIKKDQIDSINHLINQKVLNDQMDNS